MVISRGDVVKNRENTKVVKKHQLITRDTHFPELIQQEQLSICFGQTVLDVAFRLEVIGKGKRND
jgi:hypothetical protein